MVARTGVGAEDFNLLQDTGQVVWGAFQGVVLRRLLDVVEPRVYICTRWTEERPTQTMVQSQHVVSLAIGVRVQEINRKRQPVGEDASFVGSADADGDQPSPGRVELRHGVLQNRGQLPAATIGHGAQN